MTTSFEHEAVDKTLGNVGLSPEEIFVLHMIGNIATISYSKYKKNRKENLNKNGSVNIIDNDFKINESVIEGDTYSWKIGSAEDIQYLGMSVILVIWKKQWLKIFYLGFQKMPYGETLFQRLERLQKDLNINGVPTTWYY